MGVVANNGIRARQRKSQGRAARLVREHERQSPEVIQRRARIQVATRTGRAAIKARSQAEERLVTALNGMLGEGLSIRDAAHRIGLGYHQARQLIRASGVAQQDG